MVGEAIACLKKHEESPNFNECAVPEKIEERVIFWIVPQKITAVIYLAVRVKMGGKSTRRYFVKSTEGKPHCKQGKTARTISIRFGTEMYSSSFELSSVRVCRLER